MIHHILNKIQKIKESYPNPQCYFVSSILATEFNGTILYDADHCIFTDGNGIFYDKRGLVDPDEVMQNNYIPLKDYGWEQEQSLIEAMLVKHGK